MLSTTTKYYETRRGAGATGNPGMAVRLTPISRMRNEKLATN